MGRSRSHERLVPGRRARMPRLPRIHADAGDAGRSRPHPSQDPLWPAARRVPARYALLPHALRRRRRPRRDPGADADVLAQTRIDELAGNLEDHRRRFADRGGERRRDRARRWHPARPRNRIADLLAFIKHAGIGNTVWITADMHYTAAHYYDPN